MGANLHEEEQNLSELREKYSELRWLSNQSEGREEGLQEEMQQSEAREEHLKAKLAKKGQDLEMAQASLKAEENKYQALLKDYNKAKGLAWCAECSMYIITICSVVFSVVLLAMLNA